MRKLKRRVARRSMALLAAPAIVTFGVASMLTPAGAQAQQTQPQTTVLKPLTLEGVARQQETNVELPEADIDTRQPQNLRELFETQSGVTVAGGSTASQKFYVNGLDQAKLNVSIDGAMQRNNMWHHGGNMFFDPSFLKSVEIDAGVAPADAGPGALGGAARFETKNAREMLEPGRSFGGLASLGYDTNSQAIRTTGAGYVASGGFDFLGMASRLKGDDYVNGDGNGERGTADNLIDVLAKIGYQTDGGDRFQITGERVRDNGYRRFRANLGNFGGPGAVMSDNKAVRENLSFSYKKLQPTDWFDPEVEVYYSKSDLERPRDEPLLPPPFWRGNFNSNMTTVGGKVQNSFAIPTGKLTVGTDYYHSSSEVNGFMPGLTNLDERVSNIGGFIQARVEPFQDLKVSTGLRVDRQHYRSVDDQKFDNTGFSPNISAEYTIAKYFTPFAGYSYNWGGIEQSEIAPFHAAPYTYATDIQPASSHNFRGGLKVNYEGFHAQAAYFHTVVYNPTTYNYPPPTGQRLNGRDLISRGIDLGVGYGWENAGVDFKYTHTVNRYGERMSLPEDYSNGVPVGDIFKLGGWYRIDSVGVTLGGSAEVARSVDDWALTNAGYEKIDGYGTANLFVSWQPTFADFLTLRAEANNIFDENYVSRGSYSETATVTPVYSPGRSFLFSATAKF
ncbi:TonB-dependent receptor domain-containing protein [Lacibacterium aquatile]|uniref:TonB-dependent receptor domain-containing protein n=1 Tax=Lacibacterium aquatile TaxID=1168082 RepID=A0ABW5DW40_9PROT